MNSQPYTVYGWLARLQTHIQNCPHILSLSKPISQSLPLLLLCVLVIDICLTELNQQPTKAGGLDRGPCLLYFCCCTRPMYSCQCY